MIAKLLIILIQIFLASSISIKNQRNAFHTPVFIARGYGVIISDLVPVPSENKIAVLIHNISSNKFSMYVYDATFSTQIQPIELFDIPGNTSIGKFINLENTSKIVGQNVSMNQPNISTLVVIDIATGTLNNTFQINYYPSLKLIEDPYEMASNPLIPPNHSYVWYFPTYNNTQAHRFNVFTGKENANITMLPYSGFQLLDIAYTSYGLVVGCYNATNQLLISISQNQTIQNLTVQQQYEILSIQEIENPVGPTQYVLVVQTNIQLGYILLSIVDNNQQAVITQYQLQMTPSPFYSMSFKTIPSQGPPFSAVLLNQYVILTFSNLINNSATLNQYFLDRDFFYFNLRVNEIIPGFIYFNSEDQTTGTYDLYLNLYDSNCSFGFYWNSTNQNCTACIPNCAECFNSSWCVSCYLTYYFSPSNQSCNKCPQNCLSCIDSNTCYLCFSGYYLNASGNCIQCGPAQYYNSTQKLCLNCLPHCQNCSSSSTCDICYSGWNLSYNGSCIQCGIKTYFDPTLKQCVNCPQNCDICQRPDQCITCSQGWNLSYTGQCIQCGIKTYFDPNLKQCANCPPNCDICQNQIQCINCSQGWNLSSTAQCIQCLNNTYYDPTQKKCMSCPINCTACVSANNCTSCKEGWNLSATNSCIQCGAMQFFSNYTKNCSQCMANCSNCTSNTTCSVCFSSLVFNTSSGKCQPCLPGYFANITSTGGQCSPCTQNCKTCTSSQNCTECITGYHLSDSNATCIQNSSFRLKGTLFLYTLFAIFLVWMN